MNLLLKRLLKMSENHNMPVILYDSKTDKAGVLMTLDYFDEHLNGEAVEDNDFESISDMGEYEECDEEECKDFEVPMVPAADFLQELEELEDEIAEKVDPMQQTNEELALWKAKREEKEREEIEKVLEDELIENPPADPFEEDFLHTPEWHTASEAMPREKKSPEPIKEPSYHPVPPVPGAISWSDWTFTGNSFIPIPKKQEDVALEKGGEEPIFLEEPI